MLGDQWPKPDETPRVAGCACLVLSKMEPESIAPLIGALSTQDAHVRLLAAAALGVIGPDARAAIPILEKELANKDPTIRAGIAIVIGKLGGDPDAFVPAIIGALPELDHANLGWVLEDLLVYKEHAKAAVPVLMDILHKAEFFTNHSESWVSGMVSNALQQIDPAALRRAAP